MENKGKKWTDEQDSELYSLIHQNLHISEISKIFKRTEYAIELRIKRLKIQKIIQERQIKKLVHFTDVWNSFFIGKYGILSIEELKKQNLKYFANDKERFDNMPNFISLSITNINSYLLKSFSQRNERTWIRFDIDPNILLRCDNFFFYTNAASSLFPNNKDSEELSTAAAFSKMFDLEVPTSQGFARRANQNPNETTCPQAEILIKKRITSEYIIGWEPLII